LSDMSIAGKFTKLRANVAIFVLFCLLPVILLVVLIAKIYSSLCSALGCETPKKVAGEVALVTGAGNGLGRAIALQLAEIGCHIAVVDINLSGAEDTVKQINEMTTVKAKAYKTNVANLSELRELDKQVTQDLGPVTILVNNAGILMHKNFISPEPEEIQRMIDVNFTAHYWTKLVFLPTMKKLNKGHIVTISSAAGLFPLPFNCAYTGTKFGALGHMKALRAELVLEKQRNIHVCTVMPSFLEANEAVTDLIQKIKFERFYPLISPQSAARTIVKGMLRGEREIVLPGSLAWVYRVFM
ncbi:hypothetical protein KR222_000162, partial [Zaprionus bogoriensis]